jgi:hypothetical protein
VLVKKVKTDSSVNQALRDAKKKELASLLIGNRFMKKKEVGYLEVKVKELEN